MGHEPVGFEISSQQSVSRLCDPIGGRPRRTQVIVEFEQLAESAPLHAALHAAVRRFEVLRTTFVQPAGAPQPLQVIQPFMETPVTERSVAGTSEDLAVEAAEAWEEPLSTDTGPVLRAHVLRQPDGAGAVILTGSAPWPMPPVFAF